MYIDIIKKNYYPIFQPYRPIYRFANNWTEKSLQRLLVLIISVSSWSSDAYLQQPSIQIMVCRGFLINLLIIWNSVSLILNGVIQYGPRDLARCEVTSILEHSHSILTDSSSAVREELSFITDFRSHRPPPHSFGHLTMLMRCLLKSYWLPRYMLRCRRQDTSKALEEDLLKVKSLSDLGVVQQLRSIDRVMALVQGNLKVSIGINTLKLEMMTNIFQDDIFKWDWGSLMKSFVLWFRFQISLFPGVLLTFRLVSARKT